MMVLVVLVVTSPSASPTAAPTPSATVVTTPHPTGPPPPTLSPCPPGPSRRLTVPTVLTCNIHAGLGRARYDLETVASEIERWDADVVLLQEVDRNRPRTDLGDQALVLATRLRMFPAYGANVRRSPARPGGKDQVYATVALSRLPILDTHNVRLPDQPGLERHGLLRETVPANVPRRLLGFVLHDASFEPS